ncbi:MAG: hypothetical protein Q8M18_14560 [Bradyrhizobium sp.]|nr:hypothetical protein [Bradyrhizobium sp.]
MAGFAPDYFAAVDGSEIIEAEFQSLGQFLSGKSKLDADTQSGKVEHCAIERSFSTKEDLPGMTNLRSLESPFFHSGSLQLQVRVGEICAGIAGAFVN